MNKNKTKEKKAGWGEKKVRRAAVLMAAICIFSAVALLLPADREETTGRDELRRIKMSTLPAVQIQPYDLHEGSGQNSKGGQGEGWRGQGGGQLHQGSGRAEGEQIQSDLAKPKKDTSLPTARYIGLSTPIDGTTKEGEKSFPVYICGAVRRPGVIMAQPGEYLEKLVIRCGGLTEEADHEAINMALQVRPNSMICIPKKGEIAQTELGGGPEDALAEQGGSGVKGGGQDMSGGGAGAPGKVDLNTATKTELMELSGVGESTAQKIIAYREENGPFTSIEEIQAIPGIKEKKFAELKDQITVGGR